jgi:hypothetical protein
MEQLVKVVDEQDRVIKNLNAVIDRLDKRLQEMMDKSRQCGLAVSHGLLCPLWGTTPREDV